jgi:hypothetical protein
MEFLLQPSELLRRIKLFAEDEMRAGRLRAVVIRCFAKPFWHGIALNGSTDMPVER